MPHHHGKSGVSMGTRQSNTNRNSGNGNTRTHHSSNVTYTPVPVSSGAAKRQKKAVGKSQLDNYKVQQVGGIGIVPILANTVTGTKLRQASFEKNREFFVNKVLTSKNRSNFEYTLDSYKSYIKGRSEGNIDAYGNPISQGGNGGNNNTSPVVEKNVGGRTILASAPTEAEVSQSKATDAESTSLKNKKRGRSRTIMTGSKGVTKTASNYSLGKKSLLGLV